MGKARGDWVFFMLIEVILSLLLQTDVPIKYRPPMFLCAGLARDGLPVRAS